MCQMFLNYYISMNVIYWLPLIHLEVSYYGNLRGILNTSAWKQNFIYNVWVVWNENHIVRCGGVGPSGFLSQVKV